MPCVETAWRPIDRLPAGRPFAGVTVVWSGIESQPGNDCERVALARVDGDPLAEAAFAITAKLCRAHGRADQAGRTEHVGDRSGTIVTVISERFVAPAVTIRF